MTLFVAIPTIGDPETARTIKNLVRTASDRDGLFISVAAIAPESWVEKLRYDLRKLDNVQVNWHSPENNWGVGKGRSLAHSIYGGQDYAMQCDSHTLSQLNWDKTLIQIFEEAKELTGSSKTVLTSYLGPYKVARFGIRKVIDARARYPFYTNTLLNGTRIPGWSDRPLAEVSPEKSGLLLPSVKFNANFALGGKEWAENTGLDASAIFFDEEPIQSINLFSAGFKLVHPARELPLTHLYNNHVKRPRPNVTHLFSELTDELVGELTSKNYVDYINANKEAAVQYGKYANWRPFLGAKSEHYIPEGF